MSEITKIYDVIGGLIKEVGVKYFEVNSSKDGFVIALKTKDLERRVIVEDGGDILEVDPPKKAGERVIKSWEFNDDGEIIEVK